MQNLLKKQLRIRIINDISCVCHPCIMRVQVLVKENQLLKQILGQLAVLRSHHGDIACYQLIFNTDCYHPFALRLQITKSTKKMFYFQCNLEFVHLK